MKFVHFLIVGCLFVTTSVWAYDLGGPCDTGPRNYSNDILREIQKEYQAKNWPKVVELAKASARRMCDNDYRWYQLADGLLLVKKQNEAIEVIDEMYRRHFDLKASTLERLPTIKHLLETPQFKSSPIGRIFEEKWTATRNRRREFQKKLTAMKAPERPPAIYIVKDRCPYDDCHFGDWTLEDEASLRDRPNGSTVVGQVSSGEKVIAVTGELHVKPIAVGIIFDHPPFKKGDLFFLLDSLGEGLTRYWFNGQAGDGVVSAEKYCIETSKDCWAEYVDSNFRKNEPKWWVKIKTKDGTEGWADETEKMEKEEDND